ncbi:hypothetical protein GW793_01890 [bacterium]|uniref:Uncharacterized protein n=2 Tax=Katanobacteria TaxID=422282 RepID=A0A2M7X5F4_UNCKA|nr:hypothetical protein [bacterium]PIP56528.1 MAG: hypothetical protein COX05_02555 [candidate division WWE3 bacterium CG22_combo_CG10-13_8_21_14_all_39_12]PJA41405.1 MAG: hypothetical protein CO179_00035 [candidate division WWE3 bacterium CG_4_9_14_3_um_filter_39_7]
MLTTKIPIVGISLRAQLGISSGFGTIILSVQSIGVGPGIDVGTGVIWTFGQQRIPEPVQLALSSAVKDAPQYAFGTHSPGTPKLVHAVAASTSSPRPTTTMTNIRKNAILDNCKMNFISI